MASCVTCSAPLPSGVDVCLYCGGKHDTDFHGIHRYTVSHPVTERICPRCEVSLQTINLRKDNLRKKNKFYIERCEQCMGIFFDPNELAAFLENTVTNVFEIDKRRLVSITKELYKGMSSVKYIKCPECREFMQRTNYASRSGVIVDKCREHGVWLDGGELNRLMEWKKAGGELLHEKTQGTKDRSHGIASAQTGKVDAIADMLIHKHGRSSNVEISTNDDDLLSSVSNMVWRLFK